MQPIIHFDHEIGRSTMENLLTKLRRANAPQLVLIDSPGGQFDFFSVLGPAIQRQGMITISRRVSSAAVILFLLGRSRLALPDSTFFFHEVRALVGPLGEITIADLEEVEEYEREMSGEKREHLQEWRRSMRAAQNWFLDFVSKKAQVPIPMILSLMRAEVTLSAKEAVHYGIAHRILPEDVFRE